MNKATALDNLRLEIIKNMVGEELANQATQLVMGSGNPSAQVVFIGEAPGKNEDLAGLPFVGASGKMLDAMLESINLNRKEVYITNIVKYRPPNNRDPRPSEKAEFWPYLVRQLEIINPKVVVTLGRHAMNCFLPTAVISNQHGKIQKVSLSVKDKQLSFWLLPLYHPAAALYNGSMRQTLFDDFQIVRQIIDGCSIS